MVPFEISLGKKNQQRSQGLPPAVILAGGLGTRLRSAFASGPKSMAPIGDRPFLDYVLGWLSSEGVSRVILCVGYKRSQIQRFVGNGSRWNVQAGYAIEKELLGTGGAVKNAETLIDADDVFVVNGDTMLDVSLKGLNDFHRQKKGWLTIAAVKVPKQDRYGTLELGYEGKVKAFVEKGVTANTRGTHTINGGVYILRTKLLRAIQGQCPISLEKQIFPKLAAKGRAYGYVTDSYFIDIGIPEDFRRAKAELPKRFGVRYSR